MYKENIEQTNCSIKFPFSTDVFPLLAIIFSIENFKWTGKKRMLCLEASKRVIKLSDKLETLVSKFVPADPEFNFLLEIVY